MPFFIKTTLARGATLGGHNIAGTDNLARLSLSLSAIELPLPILAEALNLEIISPPRYTATLVKTKSAEVSGDLTTTHNTANTRVMAATMAMAIRPLRTPVT